MSIRDKNDNNNEKTYRAFSGRQFTKDTVAQEPIAFCSGWAKITPPPHPTTTQTPNLYWLMFHKLCPDPEMAKKTVLRTRTPSPHRHLPLPGTTAQGIPGSQRQGWASGWKNRAGQAWYQSSERTSAFSHRWKEWRTAFQVGCGSNTRLLFRMARSSSLSCHTPSNRRRHSGDGGIAIRCNTIQPYCYECTRNVLGVPSTLITRSHQSQNTLITHSCQS